MDEPEKDVIDDAIDKEKYERCPHCNTPFCTGTIEKAAIEVKCRRCKNKFQIVTI